MLLLLPAALAATLIAFTGASPSVVCGSQIYGQPRPDDALGVAGTLPYAKSDPDHQAAAARTFAEPAFFTPRFQALTNTWQTSMVQLPMIWRYKSARLALLFSANDAGQVLLPSINLTWRVVQSAAAGVLENCMHKQGSVGGVWVVSDHYRNPYLAVYVYEAGAEFEAVLNRYMITGKGINPFNPRGGNLEGMALNATVVGATLTGEMAATGTIMGVERVPTNRLPSISGAEVSGVAVQ